MFEKKSGRRLGRTNRGSVALYAILAIILLVVVLVVFVLAPAYFVAALALLVGAGLIVVGRGHPATLVLGGILALAGIILAILASLSGTLAL